MKNAYSFYHIMSTFNLSKLSKFILHYTERTFNNVCETLSFLELNILHILKITTNSELLINSELKVYYDTCSWIDFNYDERCNFSKKIYVENMHAFVVRKRIYNDSKQFPCFRNLEKLKSVF